MSNYIEWETDPTGSIAQTTVTVASFGTFYCEVAIDAGSTDRETIGQFGTDQPTSLWRVMRVGSDVEVIGSSCRNVDTAKHAAVMALQSILMY